MKKDSAKSIIFLFLILTVFFCSCSAGKHANHSLADGSGKGIQAKKVKPAGNSLVDNGNNSPNIPGSSYLGIGQLIDSASNLSRSFALFELVKKNPLKNNSNTLYPVLMDYVFNAPWGVSGVFGETVVRLKIYKNGVKVKEVTSSKSWRDIYTVLGKELTGNPRFVISRKFKLITEGAMDNVDTKAIKECLPGSMDINVPYSTQLDSFRRYANLHYYRTGTPYINNKEVFGKYSTYNYNKLFFFRNDQIPYNLKMATKPLIFPLYKTLIPCLTYLSSGNQLATNRDYGAALNSYYSALITANDILASPFERALVRQMAFSDIARTQQVLSVKRRFSSELFQLGANLNRAYLNSLEADRQRTEYYSNIQKIGSLCAKAEDKAKEIRGQKRLGGFLAVVSYAGALSSASVADNTSSDAFMSQAETYFTSSMNQADEVSKELSEKYRDVENQIDAMSFISSDGERMEVGKPFLSGEVYYYLSFYPNLVKDVLFTYASGKPRLSALLNSFYSKKNAAALNDISMHMAEIEAKTINAEVRNIQMPDKVLVTF